MSLVFNLDEFAVDDTSIVFWFKLPGSNIGIKSFLWLVYSNFILVAGLGHDVI